VGQWCCPADEISIRVNLRDLVEREDTMTEAAAPRPRDRLTASSGGDVFYLGATEPFESFYLRELPQLVALARALTGSVASAEDVAQEAMIAAYRRWDEVVRFDSPAAWVRRVCLNMATSQLRRRTSEARALIRLGRDRERTIDLEPLDADFWSAVRRLPRRQAQVIALHYLYDLAVTDIAQTLGCSESTVKAHLVRGRATLARRLRIPEGGTHDSR
jgi:RNA polymerase sigma-70 factor (sigma-E family)